MRKRADISLLALLIMTDVCLFYSGISPRLLGESSNNMTPSRRDYLGLPNNHRATFYSHTPSARPSPQGLIPMANQRTFTASNTCATNALDAKMISKHPNQNRNSNAGNKMMTKDCAET